MLAEEHAEVLAALRRRGANLVRAGRKYRRDARDPLAAASPGGRLLDHSRLLVRAPRQSQNPNLIVGWGTTVISPDGSHVLRSAFVPVRVAKNTYDDNPWIYKYSTGSGALVSSLEGRRGGFLDVQWSSPDGQSYIATSLIPGTPDAFVSATSTATGVRSGFRPRL